MKNTGTKIKKAFPTFLLSFLKSLLSSFFEGMPLFHRQKLSHLLNEKEEDGFSSFLSVTLPRLLATACAVTVFFYIPIDMMLERYHTGIYGGMGIMALLFLIAEVYEFIKEKQKDKRHLLASLILFVIFFSLSFSLHYLPLKTPEEESMIPFLLMALLSLSSFLSSFSGISSFSILFFLGQYSYFSSYLRKTVYEGMKGWLFLFVILFFGYFIGRTFYLFFQGKLKNLSSEKHSINASLFLSGILYLAIDKIKAPWYFDSETITITAQNITLITTLFVFLIVGGILIYPTFRKKKEEEK